MYDVVFYINLVRNFYFGLFDIFFFILTLYKKNVCFSLCIEKWHMKNMLKIASTYFIIKDYLSGTLDDTLALFFTFIKNQKIFSTTIVNLRHGTFIRTST